MSFSGNEQFPGRLEGGPWKVEAEIQLGLRKSWSWDQGEHTLRLSPLFQSSSLTDWLSLFLSSHGGLSIENGCVSSQVHGLSPLLGEADLLLLVLVPNSQGKGSAWVSWVDTCSARPEAKVISASTARAHQGRTV